MLQSLKESLRTKFKAIVYTFQLVISTSVTTASGFDIYVCLLTHASHTHRKLHDFITILQSSPSLTPVTAFVNFSVNLQDDRTEKTKFKRIDLKQ